MKTLLASAAAVALSAGMAVADYKITILHTNDFHARFEPIIHSTQEDHRAVADALLRMLSDARWSRECPDQRPDLEQLVDPVLLVYFPDLRRQRAEKARQFLQSLGPRVMG